MIFFPMAAFSSDIRKDTQKEIPLIALVRYLREGHEEDKQHAMWVRACVYRIVFILLPIHGNFKKIFRQRNSYSVTKPG